MDLKAHFAAESPLYDGQPSVQVLELGDQIVGGGMGGGRGTESSRLLPYVPWLSGRSYDSLN